MTRAFWCAVAGVALGVIHPCVLSAQAFAPQVITPAPKGAQMRDVLSQLSPQGQMIFRNEWLRLEHEAGPRRKAASRAVEDGVFAAMAAEPFNPDALRRAYADQRSVIIANQRDRTDRLVDVLRRLSPADRHVMVMQLRALRERRQ